MKLNQSQKLKMVLERVEGGVPIHEVAREWGYSASGVKYLCKLYRRWGSEAFRDKGTARAYSREEKLRAVKRRLSGESAYSLAVEMCLGDPTIIRDWCALYDECGETAIRDTHSRSHYLLHEDRLDRVAGKKLMERMGYLEAENAYLKKLYALTPRGRGRSKRK